MKHRTLGLIWPRDRLSRGVLWGLFSALVVVALLPPTISSDARVHPMLANWIWLGIGAVYGWQIGQRRRWPPGLLVSSSLRTQVTLSVCLIAVLWCVWRWSTQSPDALLTWSLVAAGVGMWCTSRLDSPFIKLKLAFVLFTSVPFFAMAAWLDSQLGEAAAILVATLAFIATLVRLSAFYSSDRDQVALNALLDQCPSTTHLNRNLREAMHIGSKGSWQTYLSILVLTLLILLVPILLPIMKPQLLAMLFSMWMGGLLLLPILINLNSLRALDRIWLTGAYRTREIFARAVVTANTSLVAEIILAGVLSLFFVILLDPTIAADGASLLMLLYTTSLVLFAINVWATRDFRKHLGVAIVLGIAVMIPFIVSYVAIVGSLLTIDPIVQVVGCAAILSVVTWTVIPWTTRTLSRQPFGGGGTLLKTQLFRN